MFVSFAAKRFCCLFLYIRLYQFCAMESAEKFAFSDFIC